MKRLRKGDIVDPRKQNEDDPNCPGNGGCPEPEPEPTEITIIVTDKGSSSDPPEPPNDQPRPDPYRGLRWATDDDGHAYMTDLPELSGKG